MSVCIVVWRNWILSEMTQAAALTGADLPEPLALRMHSVLSSCWLGVVADWELCQGSGARVGGCELS